LENKEEADKAKLNLEAAKLQANLTRKKKWKSQKRMAWKIKQEEL
jgi:hypothetical protein